MRLSGQSRPAQRMFSVTQDGRNSDTCWAAHTCVRWMEDASNDGRSGGCGSELLRNENLTFETTVERILAES